MGRNILGPAKKWENPGVNIERCVFKSRINFESNTMEIAQSQSETENLTIDSSSITSA